MTTDIKYHPEYEKYVKQIEILTETRGTWSFSQIIKHFYPVFDHPEGLTSYVQRREIDFSTSFYISKLRGSPIKLDDLAVIFADGRLLFNKPLKQLRGGYDNTRTDFPHKMSLDKHKFKWYLITPEGPRFPYREGMILYPEAPPSLPDGRNIVRNGSTWEALHLKDGEELDW